MRRRRAVVVAAAALLLAAAAGCGGDSAGSGSGTTSTTTTRPAPTTTRDSTTVPHAPGEGTLLTDDDAVLVAPVGGRPVALDAPDPCPALPDDGTCDAAGALAWTVQPGGSADRSPVTVYVVEDRSARPVLVVDPGARADYTSAKVVPADLDGDGGDELVVGLRNGGTGGLLQIDVVDEDGAVVAHTTLDAGRAEVEGTVLRTWAAQFLPDDPNCCPSSYEEAVVTVDAGEWRSVVERSLPTAAAPAGDFP